MTFGKNFYFDNIKSVDANLDKITDLNNTHNKSLELLLQASINVIKQFEGKDADLRKMLSE